jgi:hypothetical protein
MEFVDTPRLIRPAILCGILLVMLLVAPPNSSSAWGQVSHAMSSTFNLMLDPASVVIKVGDKATVNLTVTNSGAPVDKLCFGQEGFPDSGFVLTFLPQCSTLTVGSLGALLTVEATAAAAPQNFTAMILAITGNETGQAALNVAVVPGIPTWVPWLIIVTFILLLLVAALVQPAKLLRSVKGALNSERQRH